MRHGVRPYVLVLMTALISVTASAATIKGSATYRERMALPPDAAFEAIIEDVSRVDAPAVVIGRIDFMPAGQVPILFEIPYRETDVQPDHRYNVRVRITAQERLLYTTTRVHPVLTRGAGETVEMMLQRVSAMTKPEHPLTNTYWKLAELHGSPIKTGPRQHEAHLILQPEGQRLAGSGGCNRLLGSYRLDRQGLSFGKVASTMMACPDGMEQEAAFFRVLELVRSWTIHGDTLELLDEFGTAIAGFVAVDRK